MNWQRIKRAREVRRRGIESVGSEPPMMRPLWRRRRGRREVPMTKEQLRAQSEQALREWGDRPITQG